MLVSSRRRLPHIYAIGYPLFITFRLQGSLPEGRDFSKDTLSAAEVFAYFDRILDRSTYGPLYLRMPGIAHVIASAVERGDGPDYSLHAWVIMPNHVHMLVTPIIDPAVFMRRIKGATAREANLALNRTGKSFWQHESYDRVIRSPQEFRKVESYILQNPVKAGLAASPELYRWSSAWLDGEQRRS